MGFSRQEYWIRLPCPPPGDLPDPGTEPTSLVSPALAGGGSLPLVPPSFGLPSSLSVLEDGTANFQSRSLTSNHDSATFYHCDLEQIT